MPIAPYADNMSSLASAGVDLVDSVALAVFGPLSVRLDESAIYEVLEQTRSLTDSPVFGWTLLLCFAAYCLVIYYYAPCAGWVLKSMGQSGERSGVISDQNYLLDVFIKIGTVLGLLIVSVTIVRYVEIGFGHQLAQTLPDWAAGVMALGVWAACMVIWIVQNLILALVAKVTLSTGFVSGLARMRNVFVTQAMMLLTPVVLMFSLAEGGYTQVVTYVIAAAAALFVIYMLVKTCILFIGEKVSIFYWFLYLCAVEIIPVSIPVITAWRYI